MNSLAHLSDLSGNRARLKGKGSDDNAHSKRVDAKPFGIHFQGRRISGHPNEASAKKRLAVLNRDGELDGYEIVQRGAR